MRKPVLYILTTGWFVLVLAGFAQMAEYQSTPGQSAQPANGFPVNTQITPVPATATVVMFIHPQCPCTRASLSELERLQCQVPATTRIYIVCAWPPDAPDNWADTPLVHSAQSLQRIKFVNDVDRTLLTAFDSKTSGETFVYDEHCGLVFHGGITRGRGHEGDNAGRSAIGQLLNHGTASTVETPVFGCPLRSTVGNRS